VALAADTRGAGMEPPSIFRAHAVPPGLASPRDHDGRARRRRRPGPWPGPTLLPRARLELKGSERADVNLAVPKVLLMAALLWAFGAFFRQTSALLRFNFFPGGTALRFGTRDSRSLLQLRTRRGAYAELQIRESIRGPERLSRHLIYCKNAPKRRSNNFLVGSRHLGTLRTKPSISQTAPQPRSGGLVAGEMRCLQRSGTRGCEVANVFGYFG
jgi:hypothetical protein